MLGPQFPILPLLAHDHDSAFFSYMLIVPSPIPPVKDEFWEIPSMARRVPSTAFHKSFDCRLLRFARNDRNDSCMS